MNRTALITIQHGRLGHLARQHEGVLAGTTIPDDRIVVAMDDAGTRPWAASVVSPPRVLDMAADATRLPLATARNLGAAAAIRAGAETLIFLDVDCIPGPELVGAYRDAVASIGDGIACGPVAYLPPPPAHGYRLDTLEGLAPPHPARPSPQPGEVVIGDEHELFWSLSFAVSRRIWERVGGFCEEYAGYGAEDTDFAWTARARGVDIAWVGSARAYHQHHATEDPPVQHLDDIARNAMVFRRRWGWWPMGGWLREFERRGLVTIDDERGEIRRAARASA